MELVVRLRGGDARALSRAISIVENGGAGARELVAACAEAGAGALRVGVTGAPGAGKSTLVDQIVRLFRGQGKSVGVVGVDPSSPFTGGAILGDRIRMASFAGDDGVMMRSMATRGNLGGLARATADVCTLMAASGRDVIVVETVGVGQDEVEVVRLADVTVVVLTPGMGDEVQSIKAGVMEVADIFVINKADREGAERLEGEILAMQGLGEHAAGWVPPVVKTVATAGDGVEKLLEEIARRVASGEKSRRVAEVAGSGLRLDHLGIAVKSIAGARGFYEQLGMQVTHEETVAHERVHTAMMPLGETRLELLEAMGEESAIAKFVAKRGEGLHHIAIHTDGLDALFAALKERGVRMVSEKIQVGAGGHRYFFVHPASAGGILLEMVGDA